MYDVLDSSFGSREEPLFIVISTQSNDPEHVLSRLIDDGLSQADPSIICHLHAADEGCDLDDEAQWKKANPALDFFRDREDLAAAMRKAKRLPAEEPKVRNLFLNQRVSPVSTLIARSEWPACVGEVKFADRDDVYLGLDLARTVDLTALVVASASDPVRVRSYFWKPADTLREHSQRDFGSGDLRYVQWVAEGYMFTCPGRSVDPGVVAAYIGDLYRQFNVLGLSYDRWRVDELLREFDRIGLGAYKAKDDDDGVGHGLRLIPWGQGFRDMRPAIDALEHAIVERKLVHESSPVLNWNISNAVAVTDPAGNRKLDKDKATFRIDGAVALAMCLGLRARDRGSARAIDVRALIG